MSTPQDPTFDDEPFEPVPAQSEPPEGDVELALQEEAVGTEGIAAPSDPPPVVGRTWAVDFTINRLVPVGRTPRVIRDDDARRQAIEKCLRTERGAAVVHSDDYGLEGAENIIEGQAFDSAEFAELEERVRDALLALPWVLDVIDFDAQASPGGTVALTSFQVVPEGDADPLDFADYPLPIA